MFRLNSKTQKFIRNGRRLYVEFISKNHRNRQRLFYTFVRSWCLLVFPDDVIKNTGKTFLILNRYWLYPMIWDLCVDPMQFFPGPLLRPIRLKLSIYYIRLVSLFGFRQNYCLGIFYRLKMLNSNSLCSFTRFVVKGSCLTRFSFIFSYLWQRFGFTHSNTNPSFSRRSQRSLVFVQLTRALCQQTMYSHVIDQNAL